MKDLTLKHKPREWQKNALQKWKDQMKGVVSISTAGGKTFFSFMCIKEFLKSNLKGNVIIMVPTIPLLDQWKLALIDELGVNDKDISLGGGGYKFSQPKTFNIFVYKTGAKVLPELKLNDGKWMLIVDECHKSATESVRVIFNEKLKYSAALGLSATPEREHDFFFEQFVTPSLGGIIYHYTYEDAIKDNVIPDFDIFNVKVSLTIEEEAEIKKIKKSLAKKVSQISSSEKITKAKAFKSPLVQNLIFKLSRLEKSIKSRVSVPIKIIQEANYIRAIIFHESIIEVEKINAVLNDINIPSLSYHSKLSPNQRVHNLNSFKRGNKRVLITCEALDEGLNVPNLDLAIIASGNLSKRQRIQRIGRVLRNSKNKDKSSIYTLYSKEEELKRLIDEENRLKDVSKINWLKVR